MAFILFEMSCSKPPKLGCWSCIGGMGEWARAGSTGNGGGALARAARGADELRGLGAPIVLRTALRLLLPVDDAEIDRRREVVVARAKRPRRPVGCSGEVSERPKLPPLLPAMSTVGAVTSAGWV